MDKNNKKPDNLAKNIGSGLAHVQSFVDDVLDMSFKGLKKMANKKEKKKVDEETLQGKLYMGVKKTAGFLGEMGESFYSKYAEIKTKKTQDSKKNSSK